MKNLTKMMAIAIMGIVMVWGTVGMGEDTVTVTITNPNNKIVKVGGAFSGTHSSSASYYTLKGAKMSGDGKGSVTAKDDGTFNGTAGGKPSLIVGGTKVKITYKNKKEKDITGEDTLTVVEVVLNNANAYRYFITSPNGIVLVLVAITIDGIAKPPGLGNVIVTSTPTGGLWNPNPLTASMANAGGVFAGALASSWSNNNAIGDPVGIGISFSTVAVYSGIISNTKTSVVMNP